MNYAVKEIFYSLQGEGFWAGRPAIFCRFTGCNLWSGKEKDREQALCRFCDTDFVGTNGQNGGTFASAKQLANAIIHHCPTNTLQVKPIIVFTGGEPCLQLTQELVDILRKQGYYIAMETNGTLPLPCNIDWVCVSPKTGTVLTQIKGNELKLVYPQTDTAGTLLNPKDFEHLKFDNFFLQPCAQQENTDNMQQCIEWCLNNPLWRLSIQQHKYLGIL